MKSVREKLGNGTPTLTAAEYRKLRQPTGRPWVRRSSPEARTVGSVTFSSQAEAKRYTGLLALQKAGEVKYVLLQPSFLVLGVRVRADFQVFWADGRVTYEDAGARGGNPEHLRRKRRNYKQVKEAYGIEVELVEVGV